MPDGIVRELKDDNCVLKFSLNPETAITTCAGVYLNQVVLVMVFLNGIERDNLSWLHAWTPCGMVWRSHIMLLCSAHHVDARLQCSTCPLVYNARLCMHMGLCMAAIFMIYQKLA